MCTPGSLPSVRQQGPRPHRRFRGVLWMPRFPWPAMPRGRGALRNQRDTLSLLLKVATLAKVSMFCLTLLTAQPTGQAKRRQGYGERRQAPRRGQIVRVKFQEPRGREADGARTLCPGGFHVTSTVGTLLAYCRCGQFLLQPPHPLDGEHKHIAIRALLRSLHSPPRAFRRLRAHREWVLPEEVLTW